VPFRKLFTLRKLTLSIVSHGHGALLPALLSDLAALPAAASLHVIVTLNVPSPAFDPNAFPPLVIEVIRNSEPKGFGANHNAAFSHRHQDATWFGILNPDLRLPRDPFNPLLAAAEADPRLALLAPSIIGLSGRPEDAIRQNLTLCSLVHRTRMPRVSLEVDRPAIKGQPFYWLAGMFLLVRSDAFHALSGFDERFFLYCEDYDLCARFYVAGYGLASVPEAVAVHDAQRASHRSFKYLAWHLSSLLKVWTSRAFWKVTLDRRA
jgi:N-acetylglucosaminyl-diphospho-decaprenol L-rhamnosyltransferase